jgi:hypothetical protein
MTGGKNSRFRLAAAVLALLLLASAAPAGAHENRHASRGGHSFAPPLLPAPPYLPGLPRARAVAVSQVLYRHDRRAYSPYFAGHVYYKPSHRYLDVYYFPVRVGGALVYRPYYYCDGRLFFGIEGGSPRFFLRFGF